MTVFVCPRCGFNSHNPHDFRNRYCTLCHKVLARLEEEEALRKRCRGDEERRRDEDLVITWPSSSPDWIL